MSTMSQPASAAQPKPYRPTVDELAITGPWYAGQFDATVDLSPNQRLHVTGEFVNEIDDESIYPVLVITSAALLDNDSNETPCRLTWREDRVIRHLLNSPIADYALRTMREAAGDAAIERWLGRSAS